MKFGEYIKAIAKAKISKINEPKIVIELFCVAKAKQTFSEATARKWISGTRNCPANTYFPEGKKDFNEEGVFEYFRNRPPESLGNLRKAFRECRGSIVKYDENDPDVFCRSLVDQFLALLGFSMSEAPDGEKPKNETSAEQMRKEFERFYRECRIADLIGDWCWGVNSDLLRRADHFVKIIESEILYMFDHDRDEKMYKNIHLFNEALREYKNDFVKCTSHLERDVVRATAIYTDDLDESIKINRKRIISFYDKICYDI